MRRLFAGLLLGAFLTLVGVQAAHHHDFGAPSSDTCAVCCLAHQTQRRAPARAPAIAAPRVWIALAPAAERASSVEAVPSAGARAPPYVS